MHFKTYPLIPILIRIDHCVAGERHGSQKKKQRLNSVAHWLKRRTTDRKVRGSNSTGHSEKLSLGSGKPEATELDDILCLS